MSIEALSSMTDGTPWGQPGRAAFTSIKSQMLGRFQCTSPTQERPAWPGPLDWVCTFAPFSEPVNLGPLDVAYDAAVFPAGLTAAQTALWLDAADTSTLTLDGTAVVEWRDKSGRGRHVGQATSTKRPARTGTVNSLPVLTFDGGDRLALASSSLHRAAGGGSIWVVSRGTYDGATAKNLITVTANASTTAARAAVLIDVNNRFNYAGRRLDTDAYQGVGMTTPLPVNNTTNIMGVELDWSNATIRGRLNGSNQGPAAFQTAGLTSDTASGIYIGGTGGDISFFTGMICEVLVTTMVPTTQQRADIETYLASRWGVTLA